uniref:Thymidine kinase n=1 Tax=Chelydra serpentina TaxID=8475 RepID=A0A8C3RPY5_CHESE
MLKPCRKMMLDSFSGWDYFHPGHKKGGSGSSAEAPQGEALRTCLHKDLVCGKLVYPSPQFFPDIVEFCEAMANVGKTVIVAALDGTFQRKAFGSILNLVPLAESVVKLNAVCMECYREASYTKRLGAEREVEVIGGSDKYHMVCCVCYFRKRPQQAGLENKENLPVGAKQVDVLMQWSPAN